MKNVKTIEFLENMNQLGLHVFTFKEACRVLGISRNYCKTFLHRAMARGLIFQVERGKYYLKQATPFEIASNIDPVKLRKQYRNLIIVGGIDKRALAKGKSEIDDEIKKARILLREGGYFPCVDHGIPPDVPYENFVYFVNELRKLSDYEETRRLIPHI